MNEGVKNIKVQNHTVQEVAKLLREGPCELTDIVSRNVLAEWIEQFDRYRNAAYDIRVVLAKAEKNK